MSQPLLNRRRWLQHTAALALPAVPLAAAPATWAAETSFPARPVRVVVPFPAGGVVDVTARAVAEELARQWGQAVVVDNRPGASGNLGAELVRQAKPDGYTLLVGSLSVVTNPLTDPQTRFRTDDFVAVAGIGAAPNLWVVPATSSARTLHDVIAQARAQPGRLNVANPGVGTSNHLGLERLMATTGIALTQVLYQGQPPFVVDLINNQLQLAPFTAALALPHIRSGKLRALAVGSDTRLPALPEVPTLAELGLGEASVTPWNGLLAPAGTPPALVQQLAQAVARAQQTEAVQQRYATLQVQAPAQPLAFPQFLQAEQRRWARVFQGGTHTAQAGAAAAAR